MHDNLPRNEALTLFQPHRPDFICQVEASKVPPIDEQADEWFLEARSLETDPELLEDEIDYKRIVHLTRQAADRQHWKAILNLASLYLEGRDPERGREDAIQLVEKAMRLGVPAAHDRMGTYDMNGIVPGGATRAYAFWQKSAYMGSPNAMVYLGDKLRATWDNPAESFWANIPVATKMLECAFGQGDGNAAVPLQFEYAPSREANSEQKARALQVLHEGVKFGCQMCAASLAAEFDWTRFSHAKLASSATRQGRSATSCYRKHCISALAAAFPTWTKCCHSRPHHSPAGMANATHCSKRRWQ